ncbi:uncharacterized protein V6R79_003337 [Siganus canaliculatus]
MDAAPSGSGVFYQAVPAVGDDGKSVMKLIPVQMINGNFFRSLLCKATPDPPPQEDAFKNIVAAPIQIVTKAAVSLPATEQVVRNQVCLVNSESSQVCTKERPLQQILNLISKATQVQTPATSSETAVRLSCRLPLTVKSPVLPQGQYLQIPPNAQVRTVPAAELPPGIKKQIFTSSTSFSSDSSSPSVVYVSPIMTVNQDDSTPPSNPACHSLLSQTSNKVPCVASPKASKKQLKLIPNVSQRPGSPKRWMIEEEDSSPAPTLDLLHSPSLTSEILFAVAEREKASKQSDVTKPVPELTLDRGGQEQENALVMCNGKVYFVSKSGCKPDKMGRKDLRAVAKRDTLKKTRMASFQPSLDHQYAAPPKTEEEDIIAIAYESDEVIDLCDDDDEDALDDSSRVTSDKSLVTHQDEDNVIFVSYIPPKSECRLEKGTKTPQTVVQKETDQLGRNTSNPNSQQSTSTQRTDGIEVDEETDSPTYGIISCSSSRTGSQIGIDTQKMSVSPESLTTLLPPESSQMPDHCLRKIFGITADVTVCLQRIDEAMKHQQKLTNTSTEREKGEHLSHDALRTPKAGETDITVRCISVLTEQGNPSSQMHVRPLKSSPLKQTTRLDSVQSPLKGASYDGEAEKATGYVAPIDEDFLSANENDIFNLQDADARPQSEICVDLKTNTKRAGRARKRTFCPCCIPETEAPVVKSSIKPTEPEEWAGRAEQMIRKSRAKAVRRDVKITGSISCLSAKNRPKYQNFEVPASNSLSTWTMDKLQQQEHISRLKECPKDRETALEQT